MSKTPETLDESKQNKLRKDETAKLNQAEADMRRVLATPEGRRVMYRVLEMCGVSLIRTDPFRESTHDTYATLGEQMIGERIKLDMLQSAPDLFKLMMNEATDAEYELILRHRAERMKKQDTDPDPLKVLDQEEDDGDEVEP